MRFSSCRVLLHLSIWHTKVFFKSMWNVLERSKENSILGWDQQLLKVQQHHLRSLDHQGQQVRHSIHQFDFSCHCCQQQWMIQTKIKSQIDPESKCWTQLLNNFQKQISMVACMPKWLCSQQEKMQNSRKWQVLGDIDLRQTTTLMCWCLNIWFKDVHLQINNASHKWFTSSSCTKSMHFSVARQGRLNMKSITF